MVARERRRGGYDNSAFLSPSTLTGREAAAVVEGGVMTEADVVSVAGGILRMAAV
jgi:hypothetical protein